MKNSNLNSNLKIKLEMPLNPKSGGGLFRQIPDPQTIEIKKEILFLPIKGTRKAFQNLNDQFGIDGNDIKRGFLIVRDNPSDIPLHVRVIGVHEDGTCDVTAFLIDNAEHMEWFLDPCDKGNYIKFLQLPLCTEIPEAITNVSADKLIELDDGIVYSRALFDSEIYYIEEE